VSELISSQGDERHDSPKEAQTWRSVAQYVVIQLGRTIPYVPLVWLAYLRH
jgi:hypothetical protein